MIRISSNQSMPTRNSLLSGFKYVQQYALINPPTLDGYQVPFNLQYITGMSPYFVDIQPVIGDQLLPFWIEHASGTDITSNTPFTSPKIWVRVPYGCKKVDFLCGNKKLQGMDRSNGGSTFDFFDDFTGSSVNTTKWTNTISSGLSISGGYANFSGGSTGHLLSTVTFGTNYALRSKGKMQLGSNWLSITIQFVSLGGNDPGAAFLANYPIGDGKYHTANVNSGSPVYTDLGTGYTGERIWDIIRDGTTNIIFKIDNSTVYTATTEIYPGNLNVRHYTASSAQTSDIDWTLVRKYTANEPTPILLTKAMKNPLWR